METSLSFEPWFSFFYAGNNRLTDKSCKYLCKGEWKELNSVNLSGKYNQQMMTEKGCSFIRKAEWKSLKII